jgi:RNA polymerase sigma factor (sigma-70 family)
MNLQDLIQQCQLNNNVAQRQLYKKFFGIVSRISGYYVKDDVERKDLIQETFILIYSNIGSFKGAGSFEGWIKTIARNSAIAYIAKNKKNKNKVVIDTVPDYIFSSSSSIPEMTTSDIGNIVNRLPAGYRKVFNLYIEGYSHKEIAGLLNISEGTSKSQFFHARNRLKAAY